VLISIKNISTREMDLILKTGKFGEQHIEKLSNPNDAHDKKIKWIKDDQLSVKQEYSPAEMLEQMLKIG
jgi:hypothetical protein